MNFTSNTDIEHIAKGVLDLSLPKSEWTHAAHYAAAVWFLFADEAATFRDMPDRIRSYNDATGVPNTDTDGYHETITMASLMAACHMIKSSSETCEPFEIVNNILASPYGRSDWMLGYWSKALLFSVKARRKWVAPDLVTNPDFLLEARLQQY